jgi:hypothetical protein
MTMLINPQHALAIAGIRSCVACAIRHEVHRLADVIDVCRDAWDEYYGIHDGQLADVTIDTKASHETRDQALVACQQLLAASPRGTWQRLIRYDRLGVERCDAAISDGHGAVFTMTYWKRLPTFRMLADQLIEMEIFVAHRAASTQSNRSADTRELVHPLLLQGMSFANVEIGQEVFPTAVVESVHDGKVVFLCERQGRRSRWGVMTSALTVTSLGDIAAPTGAVEQLAS